MARRGRRGENKGRENGSVTNWFTLDGEGSCMWGLAMCLLNKLVLLLIVFVSTGLILDGGDGCKWGRAVCLISKFILPLIVACWKKVTCYLIDIIIVGIIDPNNFTLWSFLRSKLVQEGGCLR